MFDIKYLCGGKSPFIYECEYVKECNDKIDFTTINDVASGRYGYCVRIGGKCIRDDGRIAMSEEVREMTEFEIECEKKINTLEGKLNESEANRRVVEQQKAYIENVMDNLRKREKEKCNQITQMQSHINCLKAELAEIQMNKQELPEEPIKVADWLIDKHIERVREFDRYFSAENAGKIVDISPLEEFRKAQIMELKQIAEHLLVYCNHAEVE